MREPTSIRPPNNVWQFLLGVGLGAIPLALWLIFIGWALTEIVPKCRSDPAPKTSIDCQFAGSGYLLLGLFTFVFAWITQAIITAISLKDEETRFIGYGLLAMLVIGPVVGFVACIGVPNLVR